MLLWKSQNSGPMWESTIVAPLWNAFLYFLCCCFPLICIESGLRITHQLFLCLCLCLFLFFFNIPVTLHGWDMLLTWTAANGFSRERSPERNYYYYDHTRNAKLFLSLGTSLMLHSDYSTSTLPVAPCLFDVPQRWCTKCLGLHVLFLGNGSSD